MPGDENTYKVLLDLIYSLLLELGFTRRKLKTLNDKVDDIKADVQRYAQYIADYIKHVEEDKRVIALKPWSRWWHLLFTTTQKRKTIATNVLDNRYTALCCMPYAKTKHENATATAADAAWRCKQLEISIMDRCGCNLETINRAVDTAVVAADAMTASKVARDLANDSYNGITSDVYYHNRVSLEYAISSAELLDIDAAKAIDVANAACAVAKQAILAVTAGAVANAAHNTTP